MTGFHLQVKIALLNFFMFAKLGSRVEVGWRQDVSLPRRNTFQELEKNQ